MSIEHLVCEARPLPAGTELVTGGRATSEIGAGAAALQSWTRSWLWLQGATSAMWSVEMSFWGHQLLQVALKGGQVCENTSWCLLMGDLAGIIMG